MTDDKCPSCGESPMFRSVVHECCVDLQELREAVIAWYRGCQPHNAEDYDAAFRKLSWLAEGYIIDMEGEDEDK